MSQSTNSVETSSPYTYCLGKALPDGSNLYYASLYEREDHKPIVIGLHTLLQELNDVLLECSDPGVARLKFRWWQEELDRLEQQQARHPVSRYLQQKVRPKADMIALLQQAVTGFEDLLMPEQPHLYEDSLDLFRRSAGRIWCSSARLTGITDNNAINNIETMAAAYYLLLSLQHPNTFMTESCCVVPAETIPWETLQAARQDNTDPVAFQSLVQRIIDTLENSYESASDQEKRNFKHGLILNRLAFKTAREIVKSDSRLLSMRVSLTPVRKLFTAWWTRLFLR